VTRDTREGNVLLDEGGGGARFACLGYEPVSFESDGLVRRQRQLAGQLTMAEWTNDGHRRGPGDLVLLDTVALSRGEITETPSSPPPHPTLRGPTGLRVFYLRSLVVWIIHSNLALPLFSEGHQNYFKRGGTLHEQWCLVVLRCVLSLVSRGDCIETLLRGPNRFVCIFTP